MRARFLFFVLCLYVSCTLHAQSFEQKVLEPIYEKVDSIEKFECCDSTIKKKHKVIYTYETILVYSLDEADTLNLEKVYNDIYINMVDDNYVEAFNEVYQKKMKNKTYFRMCQLVDKYLYYNITDDIMIDVHIVIAFMFDKK